MWDSVESIRGGSGMQAPTDKEIIKEMGVDPSKEPKASDPMRSEKVLRRYRRVKSWWDEVRRIQGPQRRRRMKDHNFYEGEQWEHQDRLDLEGRGQKALTINRIKPALDWILGTEKRIRIDGRVFPRTEDDAQGAEVKTKLMKYVSDVNMSPFHRSRSFGDSAISGLGWLELGVRDDPEEEPIYFRYEDWRNIWYDPFAVELDLSDVRYLFRRKEVDVDIAAAMFPEHAGAIRTAAVKYGESHGDSSTYGIDYDDGTREEGDDRDTLSHRSRVSLVECWYILPEKRKTIIGDGLGTLANRLYREDNKHMKALVEKGYASTVEALRKVVRCMMFAEGMTYPLQDAESPYTHNRIPFVPVWGYRRKKGAEPYGVVRNQIDIQDDLNKRHSKALYILSTNKVVADDDATDNWDELYREANRSDGVIRKKKGSEVKLDSETNLAQGHIMLMELDAKLIQDGTGVTDENMGRQTNATSGRAIQARQDQGHVVTSELFDNLRMAERLAGEIELSLIEQFMTDERVFRVVGERGGMEWVHVNRRMPDEDGNLNDITARKAEYVVDNQAYSASVRQAMFDSMMELMNILPPEIAINLLDLVIDASDLPGKDVIVQRIRTITGQEDPDDSQDDKSPEELATEQQAMEQAAQLQALIQDLEIRLAQANVAKAEAEADKTDAEADYTRKRSAIERAKVLAQIEAREAG